MVTYTFIALALWLLFIYYYASQSFYDISIIFPAGFIELFRVHHI